MTGVRCYVMHDNSYAPTRPILGCSLTVHAAWGAGVTAYVCVGCTICIVYEAAGVSTKLVGCWTACVSPALLAMRVVAHTGCACVPLCRATPHNARIACACPGPHRLGLPRQLLVTGWVTHACVAQGRIDTDVSPALTGQPAVFHPHESTPVYSISLLRFRGGLSTMHALCQPSWTPDCVRQTRPVCLGACPGPTRACLQSPWWPWLMPARCHGAESSAHTYTHTHTHTRIHTHTHTQIYKPRPLVCLRA